MNERYDAYAVAIIVTFGAIIIGGLMAAAIASGERDSFMFALGAATAAWAAGYAMFFDWARTFMALIVLSMAMAIAATIILAF
ncbi:hypothetical protein [Nitratireductor sp. ZSWI3]|uniref:hypothetical protein n=1 Tax=Nitratireductor sp. ZSWI3 TaxID=2966359 RepID=UPI00214F83D1|nr:hypothetical protein [Nitratireductor sp. ZSWI3]MCR4268814.1 hypothetical protein [Nitratireductor sp. ZSWI3]